jgi:hypothetical protein
MLFVSMVYVAVVLVALASSSLEWAIVVYSISIGVILVATLAAVFLSDARRTFWRGFSLIAWIYMILAFATSLEGTKRQDLVTHRILETLQRTLAPMHAARYVKPGFELQQENEWLYRTGPNSTFPVFQGRSWQATQRTGHSVWAVLLGPIGGYLAMNFSKRNTSNVPTG